MALILLIASYALDWVVIIVLAVIGAVVSNITPNERPFHLRDPDIDFPFLGYDTVSVPVLAVVSVVAPAVIIFLMAMLLVPGATVPAGTPRSHIWRRKLWEWHAGWLGLALSLVIVFFFTDGMKNLCGKPRPNLLGRCQPDYGRVDEFTVSIAGHGSIYGPLVTAGICGNPKKSDISEGFRSYPSGHSSFSSAGLVYLSLFIAAKLGAGVPFLSYRASNDDAGPSTAFPSRLNGGQDPASTALHGAGSADQPSDPTQQKPDFGRAGSVVSARKQKASAPIYLLVIAFIPFATAVFISASRWFDYQHHGFDILFGFLMGTLSSFFAFRYYHLPMSRGAGWAWGPRTADRAFWTGVGSGGYSTSNRMPSPHKADLSTARETQPDLEANHAGGDSIPLRTV